MGKMSRRKGYRVENELVHKHKENGIPCHRVPLSGAQAEYQGDLVVADFYKGEVKARKDGSGFALLRRWLGENDFLFLVQNNETTLVTMPWHVYAVLMKIVMEGRGGCTPSNESPDS